MARKARAVRFRNLFRARDEGKGRFKRILNKRNMSESVIVKKIRCEMPNSVKDAWDDAPDFYLRPSILVRH